MTGSTKRILPGRVDAVYFCTQTSGRAMLGRMCLADVNEA